MKVVKLWQMSDSELVALASREVKALGLVDPEVKIEGRYGNSPV